MWTRFRNDGNVPTQYAANTANSKACLGVLPTATDFTSTKSQVANEGCIDVSGRRYACTSTEESSRLRASTSLRVKVSVCTRATTLKDGETDGRATCRYIQVI